MEQAQPSLQTDEPMQANGVSGPRHVAIIMDGNGRWAKQRGMSRMMGHVEGLNNVKKIAEVAHHAGVQVLTLYVFSTENWNRSPEEVRNLMKIPGDFLHRVIDELNEHRVRVTVIGSREGLPEETLIAIDQVVHTTARNTGLTVNLAVNYGGRQELVMAARQMAQACLEQPSLIHSLDEAYFETFLPSAHLPPLDLLIRTSGELRISNFMLWQLAYTELWFTDVLWPDFTGDHFHEALQAYRQRNRRYGQ